MPSAIGSLPLPPAPVARPVGVVGIQFGVAQGQDLDLDLVGIDRRGGLEVSYLLGVPPPLLLAGLVQFPRSLAKFVGPRTGCLVGGQERLTTAATGER
jgi:hypothetical protein